MAEHIEREKVCSKIERLIENNTVSSSYDEGRENGIITALSMVENAPAADVRPERHGEWLLRSNDDQDEGHYLCSECNVEEFFFNESLLSNYCPHCGAKMDGKNGGTNE